MKEEKLEQLLTEIYSQDISPSERLMQRTRRRLWKQPFTIVFFALVVSFNLVIFLSFTGFIITAPYGLIYKGLLYLGISCVYNLLVLAAYLHKDRVSKFFQKLQGGIL